MKYIAIAIIALGLCGCKGRTASVPEANGDTVEVNVPNNNDPSATVDAESDSAFTVDAAASTPADQPLSLRDPDSPAELSGAKPSAPVGVDSRQPEGDVSSFNLR